MFRLPTAKPHDMGISPKAIQDFLQAVEDCQWGLHSFTLVRHGHTVAEKWVSPYSPEQPHKLYSLTKSFTSMAVGFAVEEGLCNVDDYLVDMFPEALSSEPCENMRKMRLRHLLSMSTGHIKEPDLGDGIPPDDWVTVFLKSFVEEEPGSHFLYNTGASCVLACLVEKLSGQSLEDYLASRLFEPLGFGEYTWERSPSGNCIGGYGLSLQCQDIAKFGQFLLKKGRWGGRRIIDEAWIESATAEHIRQGGEGHLEWNSGYGYQFWRCSPAEVYRGDGAFGQFCVVFPKEDMVAAITGGSTEMHKILELMYALLLPKLSLTALPYNAVEQAGLDGWQSAIALPKGQENSPLAESLKGEIFRLQNGDRVCINASDTHVLHWRTGGEALTIPLSYGVWTKSGGKDPENPYAEYSAAAAWSSDDRLNLTIVFHNTPTISQYELHFIDSALHIREKKNVFMGPTDIEYYGIKEQKL